MNEAKQAVADAVRRAERVAVCTHVSPDGDAIGSALALRLILERLGKRAEVFCADPVPEQTAFLPGADRIRGYETLGPEERFDLLLPVDVASRDRMGRIGEADAFGIMEARAGETAQIDHHGTNPGYCGLNWVEGGAPAAGLLVLALADTLGVALDVPLASCLYTAIATDTGNFSHGNTDAAAFRAAARLMDAGLPLNDLNRRLFTLAPEAHVRLRGRAVEHMRLLHGGELAVLTLTKEDFADCRALPEHAENVVNQGLAVRGVKIAVLLREDGDRVKASLRSVAPVAVSGVAHAFGGGGHDQAAGCTFTCPLAQAIERLTAALEPVLDAGQRHA